jgi:predicted MPP superfamily phosphohydrolase
MKKTSLAALATLCTAGTYFFTQCKIIKNTYYDIIDSNISKKFDNFKIVHLSDLHNCYFGSIKNNYLIKKIKKINPNLIVITGDFFDADKFKNSKNILKELSKKYKIIFTPGGHEYFVPEYNSIKNELKKCGIIFLENKRIEIKIKNESIYITGIQDPHFYNNELSVTSKLLRTYESDKKFHILLSHRPDLFSKYTNRKYNLIFTGHAHGGQIRFLDQGLFAPNQGFFPQYTSGIHTRNNRNMIVNRGVGWHSLFIKINNRPEIVICTLHSKKY